jgi:hypothetical protein
LTSPGRNSSISRKAALSGVSSGGFFSQSRTWIAKVPNRTGVPTGASNFETRAVILSSPCSSATGSEIVSAKASLDVAIANSAKAQIPVFPGKTGEKFVPVGNIGENVALFNGLRGDSRFAEPGIKSRNREITGNFSLAYFR